MCRYDDGVGHPLAFARRLFPDLAALHGDKAVWKLLEQRADDVVEVRTRRARSPWTWTPRTTTGGSWPGCRGPYDTAARAGAEEDVQRRVPDVASLMAALDRNNYLADVGLATALFLAVRLPQPILLEGEAGVGKTEAAKALAELLDTPAVPAAVLRGNRRR